MIGNSDDDDVDMIFWFSFLRMSFFPRASSFSINDDVKMEMV